MGVVGAAWRVVGGGGGRLEGCFLKQGSVWRFLSQGGVWGAHPLGTVPGEEHVVKGCTNWSRCVVTSAFHGTFMQVHFIAKEVMVTDPPGTGDTGHVTGSTCLLRNVCQNNMSNAV